MAFNNNIIRAAAMKATANTAFRLYGLDAGSPGHILGLKSGFHTPCQLVEGFAPLLDTVVFRLGPGPPNARPARAQLLNNLVANLDTNTREATLRLPNTYLVDSRQEIAEQARRIRQTLVYPGLYLRNPCEGYLLIPPNVDFIFRRRSQSHLMVLLRDALLPFKNYEDVIIPYAYGLVLSAFLAGGLTPFYLVQYIPAKLLDDALEGVISAGTDKTSVLQSVASVAYPVANDFGTLTFGVQSISIGVVRPTPASLPAVRQLELQIQQDNGKCVSVDLVKVARGHRYAYQTSGASESATSANGTQGATSIVLHDAASVLLETGHDDSLVTAHNGGLHVIPMQDPAVALALLGKIYPGNVVLLPASNDFAQAEKAGKGLEPKFLLWGGVKRGGSQGKF
ncbi:hypothetical protein BJX96DRAFT_167989 [Aspergillus floccosus]